MSHVLVPEPETAISLRASKRRRPLECYRSYLASRPSGELEARAQFEERRGRRWLAAIIQELLAARSEAPAEAEPPGE